MIGCPDCDGQAIPTATRKGKGGARGDLECQSCGLRFDREDVDGLWAVASEMKGGSN